MIPEHKCYVEPFFGAGWVYFGKQPSAAEVINDIDGELINLFRIIRTHPEELTRLVETEFSGRERFSEFQEGTKGMTDIQRAVRYLYLVNFSFGVRVGTMDMTPPKAQNRAFCRQKWRRT